MPRRKTEKMSKKFAGTRILFIDFFSMKNGMVARMKKREEGLDWMDRPAKKEESAR